MKILIVEDDENKRLQLQQFLVESLAGVAVVLEQSLQSGLRALRHERPDVVLLDMTIPNYTPSADETGGPMHVFGGSEFLRQMNRFKNAIPVIVVTQFETFGNPPDTKHLKDVDSELAAGYPTIYLGVVYCHAAIHGWKEDLRRLVRLALKAAE
jgi:CheY-like chemotaxis protein